MKYFLAYFLLFFSLTNISSQHKKTDLTYIEIEKKIDNLYNKPTEALKFVNIYIQKSKKEKNYEALIYAYRYASKFVESPKKFKYADSALIIGKISNDKKLLTDAYLNKGVVLMDESHYQNALDNILIANKYSVEIKNEYLINKTIYFIAQNKIYLGLYEDANKELNTCIKYFINNL